MRKIGQILIPLIVFATISCTPIKTGSFQQIDKRLERLDRDRDKLKRTTDPVDRTKIDIDISEILLSLVGDAVRSGEPEALGKRLGEYVETIEDAHQAMMKTGRDAHRKPKGFKELEISLRRQIRILDDIGRGLTYDQREPVDKAKQQASDIRDDLLKALFGDPNASGKG